ncbi:lanthionine synthetase C family protein [Nocardiopsis sp. L17-MgMaSL7]|uniref:lanthionine synthetase C family protein n=1 Tax=Nocardiopsis sp. L17-MgMaSL7 TaxID=1938893 RepID=UPI000D70B869|nr:lanthionine synthetase C family protein [Nocardiopsis sp. L17-MgMaSL7]PWV48519.1 lanthionine synthetase-like protein [Nocardiopsis sp. L17-MgMaSL7]
MNAYGAVEDQRARTGERAVRAIEQVAERLADPERTARIAGREDNREPLFGASVWAPATLSHGHPGVALLYAELSVHDERWARAAHEHVRAATELLPSSPSSGLFGGPASVLAAVQACTQRAPGRYRTLRRKLVAWLCDHQQTRVQQATARRDAGEPGVAAEAYDVIKGLSGTGRILLDSAEAPDEREPDAAKAVEATLRHLVALTRPIRSVDRELPGWWVPNELQAVEQDRRAYPDGDFNLGLAHGIAGPLALFAAAEERGHRVSGQREAVHRIVDWLLSWRLHDDSGVYWPCRVPLKEEVSGERTHAGMTRTAWCYGAPGIASALYAAGRAFGVASWRHEAVESLRVALRRDPSQWRLDGPTICHGLAGFGQVLWRIGRESGDNELQRGADSLVGRVLEHADEQNPFLFAHLVPDSARGWRESAPAHRRLDIAGVLEGAAGVACSLLPAAGALGGDGDPVWDRCLALS